MPHPAASFVVFVTAVMLAAAAPAQAQKPVRIPDLTAGEPVPAKAEHDWNLGPTGARGWMFCDRMVTTDARQVAITKVDKGSPADGHLAVGDVLLGVGGQPFARDPRTELGMAITAAESPAGGGRLQLRRWRAGETKDVTIELPVLGSYGATAPFACAKSQRVLALGAEGVFFRRREAQDIAREAKANRGLPAIRQDAHQPRRAIRQRIDIAGFITLMENRRPRFQRHPFAIGGHIIQRGGVQRRAKPKGPGTAFHAGIAVSPKAIHHRTRNIKRIHHCLLPRFAFMAWTFAWVPAF